MTTFAITPSVNCDPARAVHCTAVGIEIAEGLPNAQNALPHKSPPVGGRWQLPILIVAQTSEILKIYSAQETLNGKAKVFVSYDFDNE